MNRNGSIAMGKTAATIILLVLSVLVSVISISIILSHGNYDNITSITSSTSQITNVTVFGLVSTTGIGTHPTSMSFRNLDDGQLFVAPVDGNHFSIGLPNHETYNTSLRWAGNYTWQSGEIPTGQLLINMSQGSSMAQSYNLVETTPNSVVSVDGSIAWQVVTAAPSSVKLTSADNQVFTANVAQNKSFSIMLPNMMTYEVEIGTSNATGATEWYYAHELTVSVGNRVTGITVDISL